MRVTKRILLDQLQDELRAAGLTVTGLGSHERADGATELHAYDSNGEPIDIPVSVQTAVQKALDAHEAPAVPLTEQNVVQMIVKARQDTKAATNIAQLRAATESFEDAVIQILRRMGQRVN